MDIRNNLIKKLATEENISFILDINELMPDLLTEIRANLFENNFKLPEDWNEYKIIREGEILHIAKNKFSSEGFFRFSIYLGNQEDNLFFGITGPWGRSNITEIRNLQTKSEMIGLSRWSNWVYKYFSSNRESLFSCIRNNQNTETVLASFIEEFYNKCSDLREILEVTNENLLKH